MIDKLTFLINKTKAHIAYCQEQIMKPEMFEDCYACSNWIEERMAYEHMLLDLYKLINDEEMNTDYKNPSTTELEKYYEQD